MRLLLGAIRGLGEALAAGLDLGLGRRAAGPRPCLDQLARFERLGDLDENVNVY
jgi:hypothetical protein